MEVTAWQALVFGTSDVVQGQVSPVGLSHDERTSVTVHVGPVPEFVTEAVRATMSFWMTALAAGSWRDPDATPADQLVARDAAAEARLQEHNDDPHSWIGDFQTWVTVVVSRGYDIAESDIQHPGRFAWMRPEKMRELEQSFRAETGDKLAVAAAIARSVLPNGMMEELLRSRSPNVYFSTSGRRPISWGTWTAGAVSVSVTRQSDSLDVAQLERQLSEVLGLSTKVAERLGDISRWSISLVGETDPLKKFQFAFFGLELIVGAAWRDCYDIVKRALRADGQALPADSDLPIDQLMWPTGSTLDSENPNRSLMFRFAVVASALSPRTAREDADQFRALMNGRNRLMHGRADAFDALPATEASELFERYFQLHVAHASEVTPR